MFKPEAILLNTLVVNESNADVGWVGSNDLKSIPAGNCSNTPACAFIDGLKVSEYSPSPTYPSPSGEVKKPILDAPTLAATISASK